METLSIEICEPHVFDDEDYFQMHLRYFSIHLLLAFKSFVFFVFVISVLFSQEKCNDKDIKLQHNKLIRILLY